MNSHRVVALGFFDGVHIGHGALLNRTRTVAARLGCSAAVLSMDAHPSSVISGVQTPLLGSTADRALLISRLYGVEDVLFAHFDEEMMQMPWDVFIEHYLLRQLHACHVVCGQDYRFGHCGEGTAQRLQEYCAARGIGCDIVDTVFSEGVRVSSTAIRQLLLQGETERACRLLGHPHLISGIVTEGRQLGRTIDAPTANLPLPDGLLTPSCGVYCAEAETGGKMYRAVVNIGVHPTAGGLSRPQLEAHLLNFSDDLYGQMLHVWLYKRLRDEQSFSSMQELKAQIASDTTRTRFYFSFR